jgi:hypothetical protein
MTAYVRLNEEGAIERHLDLTPEQYASLEVNGKSVWLRLWVVDPQPVPTATQVVEHGPVTISLTEARQTWTLRNKTQAELDAETNATDRPLLLQMLASITTDIDAYNANPDMTGTAAEWRAKVDAALKDLQRQQRRDNRILRYYLRSQQ